MDLFINNKFILEKIHIIDNKVLVYTIFSNSIYNNNNINLFIIEFLLALINK